MYENFTDYSTFAQITENMNRISLKNLKIIKNRDL